MNRLAFLEGYLNKKAEDELCLLGEPGTGQLLNAAAGKPAMGKGSGIRRQLLLELVGKEDKKEEDKKEDKDLDKESSELKASDRAHIKKKNFGIPSRADNSEEKKKSGNYPIHDKKHARAALAYGKRFLGPEQYAKLKARIYAKYPGMKDDE